MRKLSKNTFLTYLCGYKTTFCGNIHNKTEDYIIGKLDGLKIAEGIILEKREAELHSSYVEFTGGSRLYFDQNGKYSFYHHTGKSGLEFLLCKLDTVLSDGEPWITWTIYIVYHGEG